MTSMGYCQLAHEKPRIANFYVERPAVRHERPPDRFDAWIADAPRYEAGIPLVRFPVCWQCYQRACIEAISGHWPPALLTAPGADAPFTAHPREDDRVRPTVPRGGGDAPAVSPRGGRALTRGRRR